MISYWEKIEFLKYDLIIVGGGIVGLFTALEFLNNHPKSKIAVFDKGIFPDGASTKNAGFACFGSLSEIIEDNKSVSENALLELVENRVMGLEILRKTLGDKKIDFQQLGGNELYFNQLINLQIKLITTTNYLNLFLKKEYIF